MDLDKNYSRAELEAAFNDPQPNALSVAIGTIVAAYGRTVLAQCQVGLPMPGPVILPEPTTAIERFAFDLVVGAIKKSGRVVKTTAPSTQR